MDVQFHLKEADFVSAHWVHVKRHWWRFLSRHRWAAEIALAALAVVVLHPETRRVSAWILLGGVALVAAIVIRYRWSWHRQFQKRGERAISASVSEESITVRGGTQDVVRRWSEVAYVDESDRIFLFGAAKGRVLFLPKSALSQAQIVELRLLISSNAKGKAKLMSAVA
jgi:hypothetical protein